MTLHRCSRRSFLVGAAGAGTLLAGGAAGLSNFDTENIIQENIIAPVTNLATEFQDYRIGFLSDIHLGRYVRHEFIERAIALINNAKVDLLLLGGDYIWCPDSNAKRSTLPVFNNNFDGVSYDALPGLVCAEVAKLLSRVNAKDGRVAVAGNHDRWVAPNSIEASFAKNGISFLTNQSFEVRRGTAKLVVYGTDDFWTGIPRMRLNSNFVEGREHRILLSHNPDYIGQVLDSGKFRFDLCLAGHTHGGQICLPLLGALTHNISDSRFKQSRYAHPRGLVYTSRGVGVVEFPLRMNCPAEVTVITLRRD